MEDGARDEVVLATLELRSERTRKSAEAIGRRDVLVGGESVMFGLVELCTAVMFGFEEPFSASNLSCLSFFSATVRPLSAVVGVPQDGVSQPPEVPAPAPQDSESFFPFLKLFGVVDRSRALIRHDVEDPPPRRLVQKAQMDYIRSTRKSQYILCSH